MKPEQYFNRILPIGGNLGCQQIATIGLSSVQTSIDLRAIFGSLDNGDGIMVKAVQLGGNLPSGTFAGNWRALFGLSAHAVPISETQFGQGTASGAQCWPLQDGQEMLGHTTSGRAVGTGFATQLSYTVLNAKVADSNMGTGYFKLMRHTLTEPQDASRFQAPIPSWPSAAASGMALPSGGWNPRP